MIEIPADLKSTWQYWGVTPGEINNQSRVLSRADINRLRDLSVLLLAELMGSEFGREHPWTLCCMDPRHKFTKDDWLREARGGLEEA